MRTVAVIQARMRSTRLPGKVLRDLGGRSMLARVVDRVNRSKMIDELAVATSSSPEDQEIQTECHRIGCALICGSEDDVLDRYYRAAMSLGAEVVVRITADCPLVDPTLVDQVIRALFENEVDYARLAVSGDPLAYQGKRAADVCVFPRGLDVEVMTMTALTKVWQEAETPYNRQHVTPFFFQHLELFRVFSVTARADFSDYRWTVDTQEDLDFVRAVFDRLKNTDSFAWQKVVELLEKEPGLKDLNRGVKQHPYEMG